MVITRRRLMHSISFLLGEPPRTGERYGISLLTSIPQNRSCEEAGISAEWCLCSEYKRLTLSDNSTVIGMLAQRLVNHLNNLLHQAGFQDLCSRLSLNKVRTVMQEVLLPNSSHVRDHRQNYRIQVSLWPSKAVVESTMVVHWSSSAVSSESVPVPSDIQVVGKVSRLNSYRNQSRCIRNALLEKYCFCRDLLVS